MSDYERVYEEFWKGIVEQDGQLNLDQVKRELYDFHHVITEVPKVYVEITGGKLSKLSYFAEDVINLFYERLDKEYNKGYRHACEDNNVPYDE